MSTPATTRQQNLRVLIEQWGGGSALAKKLGYSGPSYLSHMVTGHRPITEKTARAIEKKVGLPDGWLDAPRHEVTASSNTSVKVNTALFAQVVAVVGDRMEEMGVRLGMEKFEDVVAMVYEDAIANQTINEEFVRRVLKLAQ